MEEEMKRGYRRLLTATCRVVNQAKRFREEIVSDVKRARDRKQ